jgi:hypothetical protein
MNRYKKGFTPIEAALIAVGLEEQQKIPQLKHHQHMSKNEIKEIELISIKKYNKAVLEVQEILNALNDETILAYQALREDFNKTVLVIYSESYTDETQESIDLELTKLTKESLAKWFEEAGEINKSNRFKEPEKIVPINSFKQAYTAEHVALIAVELQHYSSIESAIQGLLDQADEIVHAERVIERGGEYTDLFIDPRLEDDSISNAANIKDALIDEIKLASKWENFHSNSQDYAEIGINPNNMTPNSYTDIVIHQKELNKDKQIDCFSTLITKESVATWLLNKGQTKFASNVLPSIENLVQEKKLAESKNQQQWNEQASPPKDKEQPVKSARTSDSSLIDSLGIMAWMLSKKSNTFRHGNKPNAKQIKEHVENIINELKLDNEDNKLEVSNLNKDISTALKQLEGRLKL